MHVTHVGRDKMKSTQKKTYKHGKLCGSSVHFAHSKQLKRRSELIKQNKIGLP